MIMIDKRIFVFIFIISVVFAGCAKRDTTVEKVVVRLKWLHQAQFAGFYTADQKGYYKKYHLDVKLNPGGVDFPAVQMVSSGSEQFGVTAADQVILAREKGVPIVAIAAIYRISPFVLFSLKDSGVEKLNDIRGKNVGVKLGGNEELTYRAMMIKADIPFETVNEIPIKYDMSPLFTGLVDIWPGYIINEPIVAEEMGYEVNIIKPKDYGIEIYADVLFTTEDMLKDKSEIVENFVRATLEGWEYAIEYPEEAVNYTLLYDKNLQREHELRMLYASEDLIKPDDNPVGWMSFHGWTELQNLLLEQKFISKKQDLSRTFTVEYIINNK